MCVHYIVGSVSGATSCVLERNRILECMLIGYCICTDRSDVRRERQNPHLPCVEPPLPSRRIALRRRGCISLSHGCGEGRSSRGDGEGGLSGSGKGRGVEESGGCQCGGGGGEGESATRGFPRFSSDGGAAAEKGRDGAGGAAAAASSYENLGERLSRRQQNERLRLNNSVGTVTRTLFEDDRPYNRVSLAPHVARNTHIITSPSLAPFHLFVKIIRVCGERNRALLFRGWSRLCLHAASLSAAEGASAAATAFARAARAEAMQQEADAAAATAAAKVAQAKAAEREAIAAANAAAEQMEGVDLVRRRTRAILMVSPFDVLVI